MTREDINDIINAICPNDEDYEKPCISPKYLRQELEQLALDQRQWSKEPTTKNNLGVDCVARQDVERFIEGFINEYTPEEELEFINLELDGLKHLPPATPQEPRWILDSERCPEKTGRYLITYYNRYQDTTETQEAFFVEEDDEFKWYDTTEIEITLAVIAWMPLPAPYEPQESEEQKN